MSFSHFVKQSRTTRRIAAKFAFSFFVGLCGANSALFSSAQVVDRPDTALAGPQRTGPFVVSSRPTISPVGSTGFVTLRGNTRPEANLKNDRGAVEDSFPMNHMLLQLRRSPQRERALKLYIDDLYKPGSASFHHWLTADEFGTRFGADERSISAVTTWLQSNGMTVNRVYESRMAIDFSGTAAAVRNAFLTDIHRLRVNGEEHHANISDPQIPAGLASSVVGVASLHDFRPHAAHNPRTNFNTSFGNQALVPEDLATIYNLTPLFAAGYSGQGQTIAVLEDTDIYSLSDWETFRGTFGLAQSFPAGSLQQINPGGCADPGVNSDDGEAILDAEWASAAAPSATIQVAACANTETFGGLTALLNLLNSATPPPPVISMSYGECELYNGAAGNAAFDSAYQQAATMGVGVFVSSGDEGAASCDRGNSFALSGITVSGLASSQYAVAVGGTDFSDTYSNTTSTYWNVNNDQYYGSALSYIPEMPWNDSCGSQVIAVYLGFQSTWGPTGLCNSFDSLVYGLTNIVAGSGGPSGCATGSPNPGYPPTVSGTCQGWPKPTWQSGFLGNPGDNVRDIPDVSLFAANGVVWGHYYVFCYSDPNNSGAPCIGDPTNWSGAGGTSFAAPILAGIHALVIQRAGSNQGLPTPVYYSVAASEYGPQGNAACNSSNGNAVNPSCMFYDVTFGDMDVGCGYVYNCYPPTPVLANNGGPVLSTDSGSYQPAYNTQTGWDFATGIGTVNAFNLVMNWPGAAPNFYLRPSPAQLSMGSLATGSAAVTVFPFAGFTGAVSLSAANLPSGVSATFTPSTTTTSSTITFTASGAMPGTYPITITGTSGTVTRSATIVLTLVESDFFLTATPGAVALTPGTSGSSAINIFSKNGFNLPVSLVVSGMPSGVTSTITPTRTPGRSVVTLTAALGTQQGTYPITVTGTAASTSHPLNVNLSVAILGTVFATFDSSNLLAPVCGAVGSLCDSFGLLDSRGNIFDANRNPHPEPDQPNTIANSCADGNSGYYHMDESNDGLTVATVDGGPFATGRTVTVTANVFASDSFFMEDALDLYYATDATQPNWTPIQTDIVPTKAGQQTLSVTYVLPPGSLQAIRANFRWTGTSPMAAPCTAGNWDDADDLVFAVNSGRGPQLAQYDSTLKAPKCATPSPSCTAGPVSLLGRGTVYPEPNAPNTIYSACLDGNAGKFHVDESIDSLVVASTTGATMAHGDLARVTATVWVANSSSDFLDFYYAADATNPSWRYLATLQAANSGLQTLSTVFRMSGGRLQAIRANFRNGGTASSCTKGDHNDHDDIVFAVR